MPPRRHRRCKEPARDRRHYTVCDLAQVDGVRAALSWLSLIHILGLLPTKGLTLPLMSFGGSGILANCIALAILLRVDWENRQLMRGAKL